MSTISVINTLLIYRYICWIKSYILHIAILLIHIVCIFLCSVLLSASLGRGLLVGKIIEVRVSGTIFLWCEAYAGCRRFSSRSVRKLPRFEHWASPSSWQTTDASNTTSQAPFACVYSTEGSTEGTYADASDPMIQTSACFRSLESCTVGRNPQ